MARGWESKSVETQQEEASRGRQPAGRAVTAGERAWEERRRTLELSRKKAVADLRRAVTPAHRAMLEAAIGDLDRQLRNPGSG